MKEVCAVCETDEAFWFVELTSSDGDALNAVGAVYRDPSKGTLGEKPKLALETDDPLSELWASPSGAVWVGSASGHLATTAPVSGSPTQRRYEARGAPWAVMALPPQRAGELPSVTALGGASDALVFAGTSRGDVFAWNGTQWTCAVDGGADGGVVLGFGVGANEVFAVGSAGLALRFDGARWTKLAGASATESYTGVVVRRTDVLLSATSNGGSRVLRVSSAGLDEVAHTPLQLCRMVALEERVLFAAGDGGVAELLDGEVRVIKANFKTLAALPGRTSAFFLEPSPPQPGYIRHTPGHAQPWMRLKF